MNKSVVTLAVDAMGGDEAPHEVFKGIAISLEQSKIPTFFKIFGNIAELKPLISKYPLLEKHSELIHAPDKIANDERVSTHVLKNKSTSMYAAIRAVREGDAQGIVSGGNSAALMAIASVMLSKISGIDRPALVSTFPGLHGPVVFLDLGANLHAKAKNLVQFAIMGNIFARIVHGIAKPRVSLMNVGSEKKKGPEHIREADEILCADHTDINYVGFIEGNGLPLGHADVVVFDGYCGNLVLKSTEGTAELISTIMKRALTANWWSRALAFLLQPTLKRVSNYTDHRQYNGALLTGLQGIAVKSHGSSDGFAVAYAINLAARLVHECFIEQTRKQVTAISSHVIDSIASQSQ